MSTAKKFTMALVTVAALFCLFATSAFAMDLTYANHDVNLRTGPGTGYEVICVIPSGAQVYIDTPDTGSGWAYVNYNAGPGSPNGWVSSAYLGDGNQYSPAASTPTYSSNPYTNYTVTTTALNLRAQPTTAAMSYVKMPYGATFSVDSIANGWAHGYFGNYEGYASTAYLSNGSGSSIGTGASYNGGSHTGYQNIAYVGSQVLTASDFTNMYSSSSTGSSVISTLCSGTRLTVLGYGGGWYQVSCNGVNGWIPASQLCKDLGGAALTT